MKGDELKLVKVFIMKGMESIQYSDQFYLNPTEVNVYRSCISQNAIKDYKKKIFLNIKLIFSNLEEEIF